MGYPTDTDLKPKSREISFVNNFLFSCSITAVLSAKLQNDWANEKLVMDKRDFARFGFKISFERISHIAQGPSVREEPQCYGLGILRFLLNLAGTPAAVLLGCLSNLIRVNLSNMFM